MSTLKSCKYCFEKAFSTKRHPFFRLFYCPTLTLSLPSNHVSSWARGSWSVNQVVNLVIFRWLDGTTSCEKIKGGLLSKSFRREQGPAQLSDTLFIINPVVALQYFLPVIAELTDSRVAVFAYLFIQPFPCPGTTRHAMHSQFLQSEYKSTILLIIYIYCMG